MDLAYGSTSYATKTACMSGKCSVLDKNGLPCNQIRSMGTKKSPGPLKNHLKVHNITFKRGCEGDDGDLTEPHSKRQKKEPLHCLQSMVSRLAAEDGLSFRVIGQSTTIRQLFSEYGHDLPKSPNSIREMVMNEARTVRDQFKSVFKSLKEKGQRFNLTMDEWTSTAGRRYANVNVHCEERIFCLGLKRCIGSMPSEKCIALIRNILTDHGPDENDIMGITTDGAKVMIKMGRLLPSIHQQCMAHGLHLAVLCGKNNLLMEEGLDILNSGGDDMMPPTENDSIAEDDALEMNVGPEDGEEIHITDRFYLKTLVTKVREVVYTFRATQFVCHTF